MTGKRTVFVVVTALLAIGFFGWKLTARGAYESARYSMIASDAPFELRKYPDLMIATTQMKLESQGNDGSFMRLFRYISGANDQNQKVAMTTPVFMEAETQDAQGGMGFVIPANVAAERIPEPSDESVQVQQRPGGQFAVVSI